MHTDPGLGSPLSKRESGDARALPAVEEGKEPMQVDRGACIPVLGTHTKPVEKVVSSHF